jgi:NADH-quinone oxidoreductase E subunit
MKSGLGALKNRYRDRRAAILPVLYEAQAEFGWLSDEALEAVSRELNVPRALVRGVATFYCMFRHAPRGRHLIQLCTNVSCMLFGAESLLDLMKSKYGLQPGGTTEDGRFSLVVMECIGACDGAPAMLVNEDLHEKLHVQNMLKILEGYK